MNRHTHLYLCGVRQKSLHKPLIAGSGNSERDIFDESLDQADYSEWMKQKFVEN